MNRTLRRIQARALLGAALTAGKLAGIVAKTEKLSVNREIVPQSWKAVDDGTHNSNTDMTYWDAWLYLCDQRSPYHLGGSRSRLLL